MRSEEWNKRKGLAVRPENRPTAMEPDAGNGDGTDGLPKSFALIGCAIGSARTCISSSSSQNSSVMAISASSPTPPITWSLLSPLRPTSSCSLIFLPFAPTSFKTAPPPNESSERVARVRGGSEAQGPS
ncbi:hypothetical protein SLEP1_g51542 [Rubroshorea leprosula]|uniref:Uncharacterized protein n=1 Tax=Rubroshorea leprosula TaxID=152421 RepID=A0AAV5M3H2_9ROSI|nr:hypothetical protein SLEP1_g51542 [Rubroshorea leprosula]